MTTTRRSERLRRKRLSTPGLSKPGAYTLYGSGYVVESEASHATSSQFALPDDSRRARYRDSPHTLAIDTSRPIPPERRYSLLESVRGARDSIADAIASRAPFFASPVRIRRNEEERNERAEEEDEVERVVDDEDEDEIVPEPGRGGEREEDAEAVVKPVPSSGPDGTAAARVLRPYLPVFALVLLFSFSLLSLNLMRSIIHHPVSPSHRDSYAALSAMTTSFVSSVRNVAAQTPSALRSAFQSLLSFTFGGAWATRARTVAMPPPADPRYVTREELESRVIPNLLREARAAAASEARLRIAAAAPSAPPPASGGAGDIAQNFVTFRELYAADKGMPADFALKSAGASVIRAEPSSLRQYVRYVRDVAEWLVSDTRAQPTRPNTADIALTENVAPGNCWAFGGDRGKLHVKLARPARIAAVTVEHTPAKSAFDTKSAPRKFRVYAVPLERPYGERFDGPSVMLGEFVYERADGSAHMQTFQVESDGQDAPVVAKGVVMEVLSNHGADYTCLYRLRVHGEAVTPEEVEQITKRNKEKTSKENEKIKA